MATEIEIANRALILLGEEPIATLDEDSKYARTLKSLMTTTRQAFLRAHPWKFARTRAALARDATNPIFGKAYRYHLPGECLRVLWTQNRDYNFDVEGDYIHSDYGPPLNVVFIQDIPQYGRWDALATTAFAAQLALDASVNVSGKERARREARTERDDALNAARFVNATEQSAEMFDADVWVRARHETFTV